MKKASGSFQLQEEDNKLTSETQRQIRRQIYLPLAVCLLVLMSLMVLIIQVEFGSASAWADAGLILLLIPVLIVGLAVLFLLAWMTFSLGRLIHRVPGPLRRGRLIMARSARAAERGSQAMVKPFMTIFSIWAAFQAIGGTFVSFFRFR